MTLCDSALSAADSATARDDHALVEQARQGQREAFDELVRRHQRTVYRLCFRFVGTQDDAADLAQEVFVRAYRGLRGFRGHSAFATWLHRIAVNVCLNRVTATAPTLMPLDAAMPVADGSADPMTALSREERAAAVRRAVLRLPPKQRATVILRVYHDLSHQQIASILGVSVGAVKANFFHALISLRKAFAGRSR